MGTTSSTTDSESHSKESKSDLDEDQIVSLVEERLRTSLPEWHYLNPDIYQADVDYASGTFQIIMSGFWTVNFLEKKEDPEFTHNTTTTWFYEVFYETFFAIEPEARPMFTHVSMFTQGRLLVGVLSIALDVLGDPEKVRNRLQQMTVKHNKIGVKTKYYISFGEALLKSLRITLGEMFDDVTEIAWKKLYSYMLNIIIPDVLRFEVCHK